MLALHAQHGAGGFSRRQGAKFKDRRVLSDVKVVSPDGEIDWNELSRVSDAEMKALMIDVVDRATGQGSREILPTSRAHERPW
jgi:hypothetical protein